nr:MAG TPA: replication protein P [Caudoviricetes sp.]
MKPEILKATGQLLIYPNIDNTKVKMYAYMLEDINPVTLAEAIKQCINTCEFVPAVATIRKKAAEISGYVNGKKEQLIAQDAWEVVRKKASSVGYEKGLDELEGITRLAAKTVWRFFDPRNCQSYNESAAMSQFCKAYEQMAAREQKNMEIAEGIKSNGLLMEARKRAELNMPRNTEIKMLDNGHLIKVEKYEAVDLKRIVKDADISEEGKRLIMGVLE